MTPLLKEDMSPQNVIGQVHQFRLGILKISCYSFPYLKSTHFPPNAIRQVGRFSIRILKMNNCHSFPYPRKHSFLFSSNLQDFLIFFYVSWLSLLGFMNFNQNDQNLFCWESDANWTKWSTWSSCSSTCGAGNLTRTRTCSQPPDTFGGRPCQNATTLDVTNCTTVNRCFGESHF